MEGAREANLTLHVTPMMRTINSTAASSMEASAVGAGTLAEVYEKLLPVLAQCFFIVAIGYVSGRTRLVPQSDTKGLQQAVSFFFLPALVFRSLATINLYSVNYTFLASILIGKTIIFLSAAILTWLLKRKQRASFAGLFAIFCSQSNDFALGYPLITYLYEKDHPEFSHYLYLIAPIQLMILNPIGFVLMEYGRLSSDQPRPACQPNAGSRLRRTIFGTIRNPIIVMTAAGVAANFAFGQKLPLLVHTVVDPLSSAFTACALFLLGQNMVGGFSNTCKYSLLTTTLLVAGKVLAAPLVMREVISRMGVADDAYTDFGFLYGMLPPAPTVAIFAAQFCLPGDAVSAGVVAGTFAAAPLIFITATMSKISDSPVYQQTMTNAIVYTSLVALPFSLWTIFVLLPKRKRVTHSTTMWLLIAQAVTSLGGLMLFWVKEDGSVLYYVHVLISLAGIFSSRIWTAVIALVLMLSHQRSLCFVLKIRSTLIFAGFAASLIATIILTSSIPFGAHQVFVHDPNFRLGRVQAAVALVFLLASFCLTLYGLVRQQRFRSRDEYHPLFFDEETNNASDANVQSGGGSRNNNVLNNNGSSTVVINCQASSSLPSSPPAGVEQRSNAAARSVAPLCPNCVCSNEANQVSGTETRPVPDLEDIGRPTFAKRKVPRVRRLSEKRSTEDAGTANNAAADAAAAAAASSSPGAVAAASGLHHNDPMYCGPVYHCSPSERKACMSAVKAYLGQVQPAEEVTEPSVDLHQSFRHVCLLIVLLFSMLVGIAVSLWQLLTEAPTGILLELEFLDVVLNYSQGILTFLVFGVDASSMLFPFWEIVGALWRRAGAGVDLPPYCELSAEVKQHCEQFRVYHMEICANDICPNEDIENVTFSGQQMCDWLCLVGLAGPSRDAAVSYGRALLDGRTIAHVTNSRHFEDSVHMYRFISYPPCPAAMALSPHHRADMDI